MITINIVTLKINQDKEQKHTVGFVNSCKTKVNRKKMQLSENNLSTSPHRLAVVAIRSAKHTHGTVPAGWQFVVFVCVKLCIYRQ